MQFPDLGRILGDFSKDDTIPEAFPDERNFILRKQFPGWRVRGRNPKASSDRADCLPFEFSSSLALTISETVIDLFAKKVSPRRLYKDPFLPAPSLDFELDLERISLFSVSLPISLIFKGSLEVRSSLESPNFVTKPWKKGEKRPSEKERG